MKRIILIISVLVFSSTVFSQQKYDIDFKGNEEAYAEMLECWLLELSKKLEEKPYYDMLGLFYEELVTSHVKSKNIGQFFTPSDVTRLMVELSLSDMDIEPNNVLSLIVEDMRVAIKVLYAENKIDKKDVAIVTGLNSRHTLEELQEIVGIQPSGISKRLTKVCKKVAEYFKNN